MLTTVETQMPQHILEAVDRAKQTMESPYGDELTVEELARSALFSRFHFSRMFQQVTGVSPGRYLSSLRLEEAKRLLRTTDMKIIDITYNVGYSSVGTFSSRFSKDVGMSPSEYRRRTQAIGTLPTAA